MMLGVGRNLTLLLVFVLFWGRRAGERVWLLPLKLCQVVYLFTLVIACGGKVIVYTFCCCCLSGIFGPPSLPARSTASYTSYRAALAKSYQCIQPFFIVHVECSISPRLLGDCP